MKAGPPDCCKLRSHLSVLIHSKSPSSALQDYTAEGYNLASLSPLVPLSFAQSRVMGGRE